MTSLTYKLCVVVVAVFRGRRQRDVFLPLPLRAIIFGGGLLLFDCVFLGLVGDEFFLFLDARLDIVVVSVVKCARQRCDLLVLP